MEDRDLAWRVVEKHPYMTAKTWTDCVGQFGEDDPSIIADLTFVFAFHVDYDIAKAMYNSGLIMGHQSSGWFNLTDIPPDALAAIDRIGVEFTPDQVATIQDAYNMHTNNTTKLIVVCFKCGRIAITPIKKPF